MIFNYLSRNNSVYSQPVALVKLVSCDYFEGFFVNEH